MALKLNGKPVPPKFIPKPAYNRLIEFLESRPDDELFKAKEITNLGICGREVLFKDYPNFEYYKTAIPNGPNSKFYVFGNPRAILAAKEWAKKELVK